MKPMIRLLVLSTILVAATASNAQESVCDLFSHLGNADGSQVVVTGDLIIAGDVAVLGAADCDARYTSGTGFRRSWRAALSLSPSSAVAPDQIQRFRKAATDADSLRSQGKLVSASASFSGRIRLAESGELAAELIFDSFDNLKIGQCLDLEIVEGIKDQLSG